MRHLNAVKWSSNWLWSTCRPSKKSRKAAGGDPPQAGNYQNTLAAYEYDPTEDLLVAKEAALLLSIDRSDAHRRRAWAWRSTLDAWFSPSRHIDYRTRFWFDNTEDRRLRFRCRAPPYYAFGSMVAQPKRPASTPRRDAWIFLCPLVVASASRRSSGRAKPVRWAASVHGQSSGRRPTFRSWLATPLCGCQRVTFPPAALGLVFQRLHGPSRGESAYSDLSVVHRSVKHSSHG